VLSGCLGKNGVFVYHHLPLIFFSQPVLIMNNYYINDLVWKLFSDHINISVAERKFCCLNTILLFKHKELEFKIKLFFLSQ